MVTMTDRNFMEERRHQLVAEELDRLFKRFFPDPVLRAEIQALYAQNPLLALMMSRNREAAKKLAKMRNADH